MDRIKFFIEDRLDDIAYYYENNKNIFLIGIVILIIIATFFLLRVTKDDTVDLTSDFSLVNGKQENAMYYFSLLDIGDVGDSGESVVIADVFLKRPLQSEENLTKAYNDLIDVIKFKYDTNDTVLKGIRVQVYDRMLQYEENIEPVGLVQFTPDRDKSVEVVHGKDANLDALTIDYIDLMWQASQEIPKKEVNHEEYLTNVIYDFNEDVVKPLSDEEFQFYLKLNRYMVIAGDWESGIRKYLEWEKGVVEDLVSTDAVVKGYMDFVDRVKESGIKENYYEGYDWELKSEMLIKNPKWVYYLETGEYTKSEVEALKGVVEHDPDYLDILVDNTMLKEELESTKEGLTESLNKVIEGSTEEDELLKESLNELQDSLEEDNLEVDKEIESKEGTKKETDKDSK